MASGESGNGKEFQKLLSFQHCINGSHISCLEIPRVCPCCKESLNSAAFDIPPFSLPTPFISVVRDGQQWPCSLLIKPTIGDFLTTYKSGDDLHIGITDSRGKIISFDEDGVTESDSWGCCLLLKLTTSHDDVFSKTWDAAVKQHIMLPKWQNYLYNTESHNCYSFVLDFLNSLSNTNYTKDEFCDKYIIPLTKRAGEYIAIYRVVMKDGFYIH